MFLCISHSGKSDLQKSLPRKLRTRREPDVKFVVVQDHDSADCVELKAKLYEICCANGREDSLVRIVCRELESWFLADLAAVEKAMKRTNLSLKQNTVTYRTPDDRSNAAELLKSTCAELSKTQWRKSYCG